MIISFINKKSAKQNGKGSVDFVHKHPCTDLSSIQTLTLNFITEEQEKELIFELKHVYLCIHVLLF
jgi:hypothetical protein